MCKTCSCAAVQLCTIMMDTHINHMLAICYILALAMCKFSHVVAEAPY